MRALFRQGLTRAAISRHTRIPKGTVESWIRARRWEAPAEDCPGAIESQGLGECPRIFDLPTARYAYPLGAYLGDGHIVFCQRNVFRLAVYCATEYPGIIAEVEGSVSAVIPPCKVGRRRLRGACLEGYAYSKHWPCLFPQHGPGKKHTRPIVLEPWQESIAQDHPEKLLRGLLHSDGCRVINRVTVRGRRYEYPRYFFSNHSADILRIFCSACDRLGIEWRMDGPFDVSVARRGSVAILDTFVGPKA